MCIKSICKNVLAVVKNYVVYKYNTHTVIESSKKYSNGTQSSPNSTTVYIFYDLFQRIQSVQNNFHN